MKLAFSSSKPTRIQSSIELSPGQLWCAVHLNGSTTLHAYELPSKYAITRIPSLVFATDQHDIQTSQVWATLGTNPELPSILDQHVSEAEGQSRGVGTLVLDHQLSCKDTIMNSNS